MDNREYRKGIACALACHFIWGILALYWKALEPIGSGVIILYRIFLMAVLCFIASMVMMKCDIRSVFRPMVESRRVFLRYVASGILITLNWSIYIWAVNADHVIQTSMGYFMEPLIVCLFGVLIYREPVNGLKRVALCFAGVGLLIMLIGYRQVPFIAVGLGITFAVYSAVKKSVGIHPFQSLLFESAVLAPIALAVITFLEVSGNGALAAGGGAKYALLMLSGVCTALPLGLFSYAATRIPLITIGLCEYLSPSLTLLIGIFILKEPFDGIQLAAFSAIWIGLVFFTFGELREYRTGRKIDNAEAE